MAIESEPKGAGREESPRFRVGLFLFLVGLAVCVFLLGQSMVEHRFFRGGRIDRHGTLRP